jgi:hypothetical protein
VLVFILRNAHTQTDQAVRKKEKKDKKHLAAEHRAVRQEKKRRKKHNDTRAE